MASSSENSEPSPIATSIPAASNLVSIERAIVETLALIVVSLLAVFGNALVCIVVHRSRRLQSTTNYFVVSLAAADLVLTLTVGPFAAAQELLESGTTGASLGAACKIVRFVEQFIIGSTWFVLVAISADRFHSIVHPLNFAVTRGRARRVVFGAWIAASVVAAPCLYFYDTHPSSAAGTNPYSACTRFATEMGLVIQDETRQAVTLAYIISSTVVLFVVPSVVICVYYTRVGKFIWHVGVNGRTFQRTTNPVRRAKVKMVKMLMTLTVVNALLVSPYFIVQLVACLLWTINPNSIVSLPQTASVIHSIALLALFGSAAAKPIVYVLMNGNFRRGCKEVMCMSAMRCYRSNVYAITTTSSLAKKNHVGVMPPTLALSLAPLPAHRESSYQAGHVSSTNPVTPDDYDLSSAWPADASTPSPSKTFYSSIVGADASDSCHHSPLAAGKRSQRIDGERSRCGRWSNHRIGRTIEVFDDCSSEVREQTEVCQLSTVRVQLNAVKEPSPRSPYSTYV